MVVWTHYSVTEITAQDEYIFGENLSTDEVYILGYEDGVRVGLLQSPQF